MWWLGTLFAASLFTGLQCSSFENCPFGWMTYSADKLTSCILLSDSSISDMIDAHNKCVKKNSSLYIIDTPAKLKVFKSYSSGKRMWTGLQYSNGEVQWLTKDGNVPAKNLPFDVDWQSSSDGAVVTYNSGGFTSISSSNRYYSRYYICEKHPGCKKGWFGVNCDQECHCHEEKCDSNRRHGPKCSYGCEVGWMGESCSQKKEDADVRYFCVNSQYQGKYAHVIVEKKGVHYDNMQPVNAKGDRSTWCNNTAIYDIGSSTHIRIAVDNETDESIKEGSCAGQITNSGSYKWRIKIQEHNRLVSRNDQEVGIECDFVNGDNLVLQDDSEVKRESVQMKTGLKRPVKFLEEKKEEVELELIDPATQKPVTEQIIGSSVAIRIKFGLDQENKATGVRPYNCVVGSPDGNSKIKFLDQYGCSMNGFPISKFHKAGPKMLMTSPFPLFGFDDTKKVHFSCEYHLCFDNMRCQMNCTALKAYASRSRRSTSDRSRIVSNSVEIRHG